MRSPACRTFLAILIGGAVAGTLGIFIAALINHRQVGVILQAIASGLLGRESFFEGGRSMVVGLVAQELMSAVIAAIFVLASLRFSALRGRPLAIGALYGVGIFVVMNFVVVPLSAAWPKRRSIDVDGRPPQSGRDDPVWPDHLLFSAESPGTGRPRNAI